MAIVTVYDFEVSDIHQGVYLPAKGKCTREVIAEFGPSARIIEGSGQAVDDSLLTQSKRYYEPEENS